MNPCTCCHHVIEPGGEEVIYSQNQTARSSLVSREITETVILQEPESPSPEREIVELA